MIIFEIYSFSTELFEKATNLDKETKINGLFAFLEEKRGVISNCQNGTVFVNGKLFAIKIRNKSNKNHYEY